MTRAAAEIILPAFGFVFGAVVGSFLNVVIYRLPLAGGGLDDDEADVAPEGHEPEPPPPPPTWGETLRGLIPGLWYALKEWRVVSEPRRSYCPRCKAQIAFYDNIPLLSYLVLGGRCRACRERIPLRYFVVELLTAALFAVAAWHALLAPFLAGTPPRFSLFFVEAGLVAAMIAVTFIDFDRQIIPDAIDKPGMVLALVLAPALPILHAGRGDLERLAQLCNFVGLGVPDAFGLSAPPVRALAAAALGVVAGAAVIYAIGWTGKIIFRKEAMGFGDVKYMAMLGGFVGWQGVLLALLVACFAGAAIGIAIKVVSRSSYIPFGPFLSLGALVVLFWRAPLVWALFEWYPAAVRGEPAPAFLGQAAPPAAIGALLSLF